MKKLRINFVDFWPSFNREDNFFIDILKQYYILELNDEPDYIIYSCFGKEYLNYNCIKIFYTGENLRPDFNVTDYAIGFDYITFGDRYIRYPIYLMFQYKEMFKKAVEKHTLDENYYINKNKFCNFVYSNSCADIKRQEFLNLLNKYKKVDSGGRYLNNVNGPVDDKFEFQKGYKFSIAFENSYTPGYTTEKIVEAFAAGTIPIYWGNPEIGKEFNVKSFINCHDYNDFNDVIDRIKEIDNNKDLFMSYVIEPIFLNNNIPNTLEESRIIEFLKNIFEQEKVNAKRCFKGQKIKAYEKELKLDNNIRLIMLDKSKSFISETKHKIGKLVK